MSRQTSILSMGVTYRCMGISHSLGVDKKRPFLIQNLIIIMSFREAIHICLKEKYATISGRATRAEYWWFALFLYILYFVAQVVLTVIVLFAMTFAKQGNDFPLMGALFVVGFLLLVTLVLFIPSICVSVRRMHDIGRSGWWLLLSIVPIANLVVLIFTLMPSQLAANEYGECHLAQESDYNEIINEKNSGNMNKQTFQGVLSLFGGFIASLLINGVLFTTLHWPGGSFILSVIVPILVAILCLCMAIYVFKHGALNVFIENGPAVVKYLRNMEGIAFIFLALAITGFVFRYMHWFGGAQLILISGFSLMWICLLSGVFACIFFREKK